MPLLVGYVKRPCASVSSLEAKMLCALPLPIVMLIERRLAEGIKVNMGWCLECNGGAVQIRSKLGPSWQSWCNVGLCLLDTMIRLPKKQRRPPRRKNVTSYFPSSVGIRPETIVRSVRFVDDEASALAMPLEIAALRPDF